MGLHGVYKGILNGHYTRGEGGFLYIRANRDLAYIFPHELKNQNDLCQQMQTMLAADTSHLVFYVAEEKDNRVHVLAYPRHIVQAAVESDFVDRKVEEATKEPTAIKEVSDS